MQTDLRALPQRIEEQESDPLLTAIRALDADGVKDHFESFAANSGIGYEAPIFRELHDAEKKATSAGELLDLWGVIKALAQTPLVKDMRLATRSECCIVKLQQTAPFSAVSVARECIQLGLLLKPATIHVTIVNAWENTETYEHLGQFVSLFEEALKTENVLNTKAEEIIRLAGSLLAVLSYPETTNSRTLQNYSKENSITDIARRLLLAAGLAETVMDAGISFQDRASIRVVNNCIRSATRVGSYIFQEARFCEDQISEGTLRDTAEILGLGPYPDKIESTPSTVTPRLQIGERLLRSALTLLRGCFKLGCGEDNKAQIHHRYLLTKTTVEALFRELRRSKLEFTDAEREAIAAIAFCTLRMAADGTTQRIQPSAVSAALKLVLRGFEAPAAQAEPTSSPGNALHRANCVIAILYRGLSMATVVKDLITAQQVMDQALNEDPGAKVYAELRSAIEGRVQEIQPTSPQSTRTAPQKRPTSIR